MPWRRWWSPVKEYGAGLGRVCVYLGLSGKAFCWGDMIFSVHMTGSLNVQHFWTPSNTWGVSCEKTCPLDPLCSTGRGDLGMVTHHFNLKDEVGQIQLICCKNDLQDEEENVPNSAYPVGREPSVPEGEPWVLKRVFVEVVLVSSVGRSSGFSLEPLACLGVAAPTSGFWSSWRLCGLCNVDEVPFSAGVHSVVCN